MKFITAYDFELEVEDVKLYGLLNDLKKSEAAIYKKKAKKLSEEKAFRLGLEMRVDSDNKDEILKLGEDYGYEIVFKTIMLDIMESAKKKSKASRVG